MCMRKTAIYELAVKFLTLSFDSPSPISLQSAKFWRFGDVFRWFFCILYAECLPYFNFRFDWHTDLERIPHALTSKVIIPTKFEVDMTIHCRVIAFLSADTSRDLSTLNSCCARVAWPTFPPSLKTLRLSLLELSYNVSRWLPLKMHTRPLRMRGITWPVSRGWKTIIFLESDTPICLFTTQRRRLYNLYN